MKRNAHIHLFMGLIGLFLLINIIWLIRNFVVVSLIFSRNIFRLIAVYNAEPYQYGIYYVAWTTLVYELISLVGIAVVILRYSKVFIILCPNSHMITSAIIHLCISLLGPFWYLISYGVLQIGILILLPLSMVMCGILWHNYLNSSWNQVDITLKFPFLHEIRLWWQSRSDV